MCVNRTQSSFFRQQQFGASCPADPATASLPKKTSRGWRPEEGGIGRMEVRGTSVRWFE
jgi:hypothetical protein